MAAKSSIQHILTPETEKHFFQEQILPPLLRGESVTIFWVPHGGIRTQMMFIANNPSAVGFDALDKYRLLYINPYELTEDSPEGYFRLMNYNLGNLQRGGNEKNSFYLLREKILDYLKNKTRLIFILAEFNRLNYPCSFYNNVFSLYQLDQTRVHFIFNFSRDTFIDSETKKYDQLEKLLVQNIIHFPLLNETDSNFIIRNLIEKHHYNIKENLLPVISRIAGGHPSITNSCLRVVANHPEVTEEKLCTFCEEQSEIRIMLEDIWSSLSDQEKDCLRKLVNNFGVKNEEIPKYLFSSRILRKENSHLSLFSPLFSSFIKKQKGKKNKISINPQTGQLLINDLPPKEKITLNEYRLLSAFLERSNEIISRDQIAEILWGKDSYHKYSDWAIDQLISLIRKKLELLEISPNNIKTIKGRGYCWEGN